ncbi:YkvA family protein [Jiulongibacter sp. NS-SX5]|uniref:YkvA family protein n=1 Tax=Jiulongibacter sp. NS-SX5 TaxID=3463854 RepID=UPI004059DD6D
MADQQQNEEILKRVLNSIFFRNSMGKAGRISRNASSLLNLLKDSLNKTQELGVGGVFDSIRKKVVSIGRLLKAYASGEYRDIELKNLVIMIASLVYFLSPIDLIPDFLPMLGYADDIALLTYVLRSVSEEVEKFRLWEMNKDLN